MTNIPGESRPKLPEAETSFEAYVAPSNRQQITGEYTSTEPPLFPSFDQDSATFPGKVIQVPGASEPTFYSVHGRLRHLNGEPVDVGKLLAAKMVMDPSFITGKTPSIAMKIGNAFWSNISGLISRVIKEGKI